MCTIFCGQFENNVTSLEMISDVALYILDSSVAIMNISLLSSTFGPNSSIALALLNQSLQVQDIKKQTVNGN